MIYLVCLSCLSFVKADLITPRMFPDEIVTNKQNVGQESVPNVTSVKTCFSYIEANIGLSIFSCLSYLNKTRSFDSVWNCITACASSDCQKFKGLLETNCARLKKFNLKGKLFNMLIMDSFMTHKNIHGTVADIIHTLGIELMTPILLKQMIHPDLCLVKFPQSFKMESEQMLRGLAFRFKTDLSFRINVTFLHFELLYEEQGEEEIVQFINSVCYANFHGVLPEIFRNCFKVHKKLAQSVVCDVVLSSRECNYFYKFTTSVFCGWSLFILIPTLSQVNLTKKLSSHVCGKTNSMFLIQKTSNTTPF